MATTDLDPAKIKQMSKETQSDLNADPITGEPGAHPVVTGASTAVGVVGGVYMGMAAGPVGSLVGGIIGGVIGGLAGHSVAESKDPAKEEAYWRENYSHTTYFQPDYAFDQDYLPAYRLGDEIANIEDDEFLKERWDAVKGTSRLTWAQAYDAIRDAWLRAHPTEPRVQDS